MLTARAQPQPQEDHAGERHGHVHVQREGMPVSSTLGQRSLYSGWPACQSRRRAGLCFVSPWTGHGRGTRSRGAMLMVVLDGASLTVDSLAAVAEGRDEVVLAPAARDRMAAAREVVDEALRSEAAVYGLTTALAERKSVVLDAAPRRGLSRFLIRGHLLPRGPPAPPPLV